MLYMELRGPAYVEVRNQKQRLGHDSDNVIMTTSYQVIINTIATITWPPSLSRQTIVCHPAMTNQCLFTETK